MKKTAGVLPERMPAPVAAMPAFHATLPLFGGMPGLSGIVAFKQQSLSEWLIAVRKVLDLNTHGG